MIMKGTRKRLITLAARCLFDIEGTAARAYLETIKFDFINPETGVVRTRDVSLEGAFKAAGDCIREGIRCFEQKYPGIANQVRSGYLPG
jgi:hypothetical protein